ncbi:hypothetical protein KJ903_03385 [Patescibacteria group bacterium]|nr:hypothetical protein [Patescibacteria group bacterium]
MDRGTKGEFIKTRSELARTRAEISETNQKMDSEFIKTNQKMDSGFEKVDERLNKIDKGFENLATMIKAGFDNVVTKDQLKEELTVELNKHRLKTQDFIEDKIADLKGELVLLTRGVDNKLFCMVDKLGQKKILGKGDTDKLASMESFPRTVA